MKIFLSTNLLACRKLECQGDDKARTLFPIMKLCLCGELDVRHYEHTSGRELCIHAPDRLTERHVCNPVDSFSVVLPPLELKSVLTAHKTFFHASFQEDAT